MLKCSEDVHASVALTQFKVWSESPLRVIPPPSANISVGEAIEFKTILGSSIVRVEELTVVVVPLICFLEI